MLFRLEVSATVQRIRGDHVLLTSFGGQYFVNHLREDYILFASFVGLYLAYALDNHPFNICPIDSRLLTAVL